MDPKDEKNGQNVHKDHIKLGFKSRNSLNEKGLSPRFSWSNSSSQFRGNSLFTVFSDNKLTGFLFNSYALH